MALRAEAVAAFCHAVENAERENRATLTKAKQTEGEVTEYNLHTYTHIGKGKGAKYLLQGVNGWMGWVGRWDHIYICVCVCAPLSSIFEDGFH